MDSLMGSGTTTATATLATTATVHIQNVDPVTQNGNNQPQNNTNTKIIINNGKNTKFYINLLFNSL